MSIRSIESAGDQRHIKINSNHSAANKVRKVSAVSIPLDNVMIYIDLFTNRLDLIYRVALLSISQSSSTSSPHSSPRPRSYESNLCEAIRSDSTRR